MLRCVPGSLQSAAISRLEGHERSAEQECGLSTSSFAALWHMFMDKKRGSSLPPRTLRLTASSYQKNLRPNIIARGSVWTFVMRPNSQPAWWTRSVLPLGRGGRQKLGKPSLGSPKF